MAEVLSIIIPCYNCAATLEEAVESVYIQELQIPFEIVMVDDGSTDGTRELIVALSRKHLEIRYTFHGENLGGGAARNTAVEHSEGDLIFCVDSDDILPPRMLSRMVDYLEEKRCDGVTFSESRFFRGLDKWKRTSSDRYPVCDEPIGFEALFAEQRCPVVINFLYTKASFHAAGGYPTEHGFDTVGYGYRYLSKGLSVYTCPDTFYHHRQVQRNSRSYFERAYEAGEYSRNMYLILEEIMHLLSHSAMTEILNYDIWSNNELGKNNIMSHLKNLRINGTEDVFLEDYQRYLRKDGWDVFFEEHKDSAAPMDAYCCGIHCYKKGDYSKSLQYYNRLLSDGYGTRILYMNLLRILMSVSGQYGAGMVEASCQQLLNSMVLTSRRLFTRGRWLGRCLGLRKVARLAIVRTKGAVSRLLLSVIGLILDRPLALPTAREAALVEELRTSFRELFQLSAMRCGASSENAWLDNCDRLRECVLKGDPREFLRWDVVSETMFVGNAGFVSDELGYLRSHSEWHYRWRNAIREVQVGRPIPYWRHPSSSGNSIHHAYHLAKFEEVTATRIDEPRFIFEFGGGYGSLCRLIHNLGFEGRYLIFDFPVLVELQRFYFKSVGVPVISIEQFWEAQRGVLLVSDVEQLGAILGNDFVGSESVFIALWSLSEAPKHLRDTLLPMVTGFEAFLIAYQHRFREVDNTGYFWRWRKALQDVEWHSWRIEHLPHDNYLVGRRKLDHTAGQPDRLL